jgi:ABC-type sugar transport system ATPase subunit
MAGKGRDVSTIREAIPVQGEANAGAIGSVILEMKHIYKHFGGVHALSDVDFTLRRGEVHALLGENGAGKSTLMKILIGLLPLDEGTIIYKGQEIRSGSVRNMQELGVSMIFQEFNQVSSMSVMENIYLGREPRTKTGCVDFKKMYADSKALLARLGVEMDPKTLVRDMTVAKHQLVEIVKAISLNAEIIIMDEPTSALSQNEIEYLLSMVRTLRDQNKAIVFISHKMEEIFGLCDRVTVLRDGRFVHTGNVADVTEKELIRMMVDRDVNELFPKQQSRIGDVLLEVKNLTVKGQFEDISFMLHEGEILGVSGLMGAGRTELMEAIVGTRRPDGGEVLLRGKKIVNRIPRDAIRRGIAMVPEDRKRRGVFLKLTVRDNILMSAMQKCLKGAMLRKKLQKRYCGEYEKMLEIKCSSDMQVCRDLSGGNQQKVAVSRVLNACPDIIILDEPTRGIDVKTKAEIHRLMSELACTGKAVLMVSSELPEILGMSDRILVLHEGIMTGILRREEATASRIMELAIKTTKMGA